MTTQPPSDITRAAVLFSHQFATLVSAGVPLVRVLWILETEAPSPYVEVVPTIRRRIEEGQTLYRAISDLPDLFPPFYRVMIRAGEVGGILDITLDQAAKMLQEDWALSQMCITQPMLMSVAKGSVDTDWQQLPPTQRTLQLLLFFRAWGSMLSSGVPLLQAMEVAAESLYIQQRKEVLAARRIIVEHGTTEEIVAQMSFLPRSAQALLTLGVECGELDTLLLKAAELYRHQLVYQRQGG